VTAEDGVESVGVGELGRAELGGRRKRRGGDL
jgi:hypothetical protein